MDVPFAPCRYNAGQMLPCRDNDGAVRIMNMGNLPFTKELRDYHMGKIAERAAFEHRKATFQMVTDDVYAISQINEGGTENEDQGCCVRCGQHRILF